MGVFGNFFSRFWPDKTFTNKLLIGWFGQDGPNKYPVYDKSYPIEEGYANNTDVFAIVDFIKSKAINIPLKLYNGENEVTDGEVFDFFMKPNDEETLKQFNEWALIYYLLNGNSIVNKKLQFGLSGPVDKLINLHYPCVNVQSKVNEDRQVVADYYEYHLMRTNFSRIDPEDIIHTKYANPTQFGFESFLGLSPIQAGYLSLVGSNNLNVANASILKNKGASGVFSNESESFLMDDQRKRSQAALDELIAGANKFGKIIQSPAKLKYYQLGMSPADLKLIESGVMKKRDLCTIYNIDSSLFNDPANTTYNNRREAQKAAYTNAIMPVVDKVLIDSIWNPVIKTWGDNYRVEMDKSKITALQQDEKDKAVKGRSVNQIIINTLKEESLTPEQKVQTLMRSLEIPESEAQQIVSS